MKKQLLFSLAMATGMVAFAAAPVQTQEVPAAVASQEAQVSIREMMLKSYDRTTTMSKDVDETIISNAEGTDSMTATYALPGGVFYVGGMQDYFSATLANPYLYIPTEVPLFWDSRCYPVTEGAQWKTSQWTYEQQIISGTSVSLEDVTIDKDDLTTTPFYSLSTSSGAYYPPAPTFTINANGDGSRPSSYNACPGGMYSRMGRPTFNFGGTYGVQQMMLTNLYPEYYVGGFANLTGAGAMEYGMVYFSNIALGESYFSDSDAKISRFGIYMPAPSKTFGLSGIALRLVVDAFGAEKMTFDVYEAEPVSGKPTYEVGKRIGGGYLNGSEIKPDAVNYVDVILPVMDGEEESFVNIDKGVVILIGGFENDAKTSISWPIYVGPSSSPLAAMNRNFVAEFSEPLNYVRYLTPGSTNSAGVQFVGMQLACQYIGQYASLGVEDDAEGAFDMVVGAEGGEKEFTFLPYEDISTDGKFTGEGANDWVLFEVGDIDLIDYSQTVTVMVDPLPEGVSGRETTVYVEICGAKQAINIKQGSVSAIDEVGTDASEVVATQYFDLQGRALNAAPEAGLYLKKEVRANGNVSTVKVAE